MESKGHHHAQQSTTGNHVFTQDPFFHFTFLPIEADTAQLVQHMGYGLDE